MMFHPGLHISLVRELGGVKATPISCLDQGLLNLLYKKNLNNKKCCCCMEALGVCVSSLSLTHALL